MHAAKRSQCLVQLSYLVSSDHTTTPQHDPQVYERWMEDNSPLDTVPVVPVQGPVLVSFEADWHTHRSRQRLGSHPTFFLHLPMEDFLFLLPPKLPTNLSVAEKSVPNLSLPRMGCSIQPRESSSLGWISVGLLFGF